MNRSYYNSNFQQFLNDHDEHILGVLTKHHGFDLNAEQKNAWIQQIILLKSLARKLNHGYIAFEFEIPRMSKRIDNILLINDILFVIEFKIGEDSFRSYDKKQVEDYVLDLKFFHEGSHNKTIVPILLITNNDDMYIESFQKDNDGIYNQINATPKNILKIVREIISKSKDKKYNYNEWENSPYHPTRNIIESAKESYSNHGVVDIKKSEGDRENLKSTRECILNIIKNSRVNNKKSICFITGVPGSGKTLVGLDVIKELTSKDKNTDIRSSYLSGNGPLVNVLREALSRDKSKKSDSSKSEAQREVKQFIQPIHAFRAEYLDRPDDIPNEKVIFFDEAQRCWDKDGLSRFLKKQGKSENKSEAELLIDIMDRHEDWSTIVCLIGGGQEINHDEGGLLEWFEAVSEKFHDWNLYYPSAILTMPEYNWDNKLDAIMKSNSNFFEDDALHLNVSLRSFRAENLSNFIEHLLNLDDINASKVYKTLQDKYPIVVTRDLSKAKEWIREKRRGNERIGILASAGGKRLYPEGVSVYTTKPEDVKHYFLNEDEDVRSSNFLERTVTEFDIQGLELDWSIVAWDYDMSIQSEAWLFKSFRGKDWTNISKDRNRLYRKNAYRVLLTRSRRGMCIFVPQGDDSDYTRKKEFYDGTFGYLKRIGIYEI